MVWVNQWRSKVFYSFKRVYLWCLMQPGWEHRFSLDTCRLQVFSIASEYVQYSGAFSADWLSVDVKCFHVLRNTRANPPLFLSFLSWLLCRHCSVCVGQWIDDWLGLVICMAGSLCCLLFSCILTDRIQTITVYQYMCSGRHTELWQSISTCVVVDTLNYDSLSVLV